MINGGKEAIEIEERKRWRERKKTGMERNVVGLKEIMRLCQHWKAV